jgi:capsular polysaccharide biosynthesis protein
MENEISLIDIIRVINKRKFLIVALMVVFTCFAVISTCLQPRLYRASATILPLGSSGGGSLSSMLSEFSFLGGGGGGYGWGNSASSNLIIILNSRTLAMSVNDELSLQNISSEGLVVVKRVSKDKTAPTLLFGRIEIKPIKEGPLAITGVSPDPEMAARIANTYIKKLGDYLIKHPSLNVSFQLIDPAVPPMRPPSRGVIKKAVLALIAAIFVGIMLAFVLEFYKNFRNELKREG